MVEAPFMIHVTVHSIVGYKPDGKRPPLILPDRKICVPGVRMI